MSLRNKVFLILLSAVLLYAGANYAILQHVVYPGFLILEQDAAHKDMTRVTEALQREIHHLETLSRDWAAWDDTYNYILEKDADYVESNLVESSFTSNDLNLIYLLDLNGQVVWGQIWDLESEEQIRLEAFPPDRLPQDHPLLTLKEKNEKTGISGIFFSDRGPMLVSAQPILTSDDEGPSRGAFLMARFLGSSAIESLVEQTRVDFQAWFSNDPGIPADAKAAVKLLSSSNPMQIVPDGDARLLAYTAFADITGKASLTIKATIERPVSQKGSQVIRIAALSTVASSVIILLILVIVLRSMVLDPIKSLTEHVIAVGQSGDLARRVHFNSRDEIGRLGREFNQMVEQLADSRNHLLELSYHSGLAEMASGVLHNVRNMMTPMVSQIGMARERIAGMPLGNVAQAATELDDGVIGSERKESLQRYLQVAGTELVNTIRETDELLQSLSGQFVNIEMILAEQDKFSHFERGFVLLDPATIIQEAVRIMPEEYQPNTKIELDASVFTLPPVLAEPVVLKQVLVNLLNNAVESARRAGTDTAEVVVSGDGNPDNEASVGLIFRDNGEGMDTETVRRVFNRGFSTKACGSSGIGLHWCANVISAMKGRIYAQSDGPGQGSRFHLELPVSLKVQNSGNRRKEAER